MPPNSDFLDEMNEEISTDLLYKWDKKSIKIATDNPLIVQSVQIWYKLHELFKQKGFLSPKTPLWKNRIVTSAYGPRKALVTYSTAVRKEPLCLWNSLNRNIAWLIKTSSAIYNYVIRINHIGWWYLPTMTPVEQWCYADQPLLKTISRVYVELITTWSGQILGINLDEELWGNVCRDGVTSTLNSRYRLLQFNFLHQLYITAYKLHKYNSKYRPFVLGVV